MDEHTTEPELLHQFKNLLAINLSFCELLLGELAEGDPRRADLLEMQKAARDALALVPQLAVRMR